MPEPPPALARPRLLVLASTYPRWADDPEPGFVHALNRRLGERFEVLALAPAAPGARREEVLDGVVIRRYRYAPHWLETLVSGGGILANLKRSPWKYALLPGFVLGQYWAARQWTARFRPAIVHAHWLVPQALVARSIGGPPYLVTAHGGDLFGLRGRVAVWLKRRAAGKAAGISVVSAAMLAPARQLAGLAGPPVVVMPMGVDLQHRFSPDPSVVRDPDELLFVGRLVEKKGLAILLQALPDLFRSRPRLHLSVIGEGPEREACQRLARRLGIAERVVFFGSRRQAALPAFYRRAGLFVAPFVEAASGDREGLGLVLVEAAGCGCPMVVSELSACRDVLAVAGGARSAPPGEVAALRMAVAQALDEQAALVAAACAARPALLARFDWAPVAAAYAEWLQAALEQ